MYFIDKSCPNYNVVDVINYLIVATNYAIANQMAIHIFR